MCVEKIGKTQVELDETVACSWKVRLSCNALRGVIALCAWRRQVDDSEVKD